MRKKYNDESNKINERTTKKLKQCVICREKFKITGREHKAETRTLCKECRKIGEKLETNEFLRRENG